MNMENRTATAYLILVVCSLPFFGWAGARAYSAVTFDQDVGGHLKLAADANSIELSEAQLELAIEGMDKRGICNAAGDCFTSIIYRTPDEDVGFWRENIESTLADLQGMSDEERGYELVVSNQLLKVRETLLDTGSNGDHVTAPDGISVYGDNRAMGIWGFFSILALAGGLRIKL